MQTDVRRTARLMARARTTLRTLLPMTLLLATLTVSAQRTPRPVPIAPLADCAAFNVPVYHRINPTTQANLLTTSAQEAAQAAAQYGFTVDMGTAYRVAAAPSATAGLQPVYRLHSAASGDFRWSLGTARLPGYRSEGVRFAAASSASASACLKPVFELGRDGKVRQTMATAERDALLGAGWTSLGVAYHARPALETQDVVFSIAVIPDTQQEVLANSNDRFINRTRWLVDNRAAQDIRFVLHSGDLSNWGDVEPQQFVVGRAAMAVLEDADLHYAVSPGNHDTAAVCTGGSACPAPPPVREAVRNTSTFNQYFPASAFGAVAGTFEVGKVDNSYSYFDAGGASWLVLTLELWPRVAAIDWARSVIAAHPQRNVIIVTHAYLEGDGSISQSNGGYGATSPQYLYDNLVKLTPNVKMVFSGHVGQAASRTDSGIKGNRILSFLGAFHSTTNPVRLVEIDTQAGTVTSLVYAPKTNTQYPEYDVSYSGMEFIPSP